MLIREDDLRGPEVAGLLMAHLDHTSSHSPAESMHALDLAAMRAPEITFWTAWDGADLLGCGALKELGKLHGEIKSMHTAQVHRGKGVASAILGHILDEARRRKYERLSLETGGMDVFAPARALYAGFGFSLCEPFGSYREDPFSVFMTLHITDCDSTSSNSY